MRNSLLLSTLFGALLLIGGCSTKPSLVGTWTSDTTLTQGVHTQSEDVYSPDGKFVSKSRLSGPAGGNILATDTGTWKLAGEDMLTIVLTNVDWDVEGGSAEAKAKVRKRLEQNKKAILEDVNKQFPVKIKWNGQDEFSSTSNGRTDTYRRKK